jgi:glycosyltransferase involved in cell wall biosynthesis
MTPPLSPVSVILVTCDRPLLLADALRSVAAQTRPALEVLVADDGATPADRAAPAGLALRWCATASAGLARARNIAARASRGEMLAFLDDDDRWRPDHLERLIAAFGESACDLAYTDAVVVRERVDADGTRVDLEERALAYPWDPEMMRTNDWIAPSSLAVRRALFERLSGFDESFAFSEDWDFIMRAARVTTPRHVPGISVEVRMRSSGHLSLDGGAGRLACLGRLAERHRLPALEPRTFWEVAQVLAQSGRAT